MGSASTAAADDANGGDAAGTGVGDGGDGPALLLACMGGTCACACMGDGAAAAAAGARCMKLNKLCWPCLAFLPESRSRLHFSTCMSLLNLLSKCLEQYGHFRSSILTLLALVHLVKL